MKNFGIFITYEWEPKFSFFIKDLNIKNENFMLESTLFILLVNS